MSGESAVFANDFGTLDADGTGQLGAVAFKQAFLEGRHRIGARMEGTAIYLGFIAFKRA